MKIQLLLYFIPFGFSLPIQVSPVSALTDLSSHPKMIDLNSLLRTVTDSLLSEIVAPQPLRIRKSQHINELHYDGSDPVISMLEIWHEVIHFGKKIIVTYTPVNVFITKKKIKIYAIENVLGGKSNAYPVIITIFNSNLLGAQERYYDLKHYYVSYDSKSSHLMYSDDKGLILVGPNFVDRFEDSRADLSFAYNRVAVRNSHPELPIGAQDNYAIQQAAYEGHTEEVELLLNDPRVDPAADKNKAIRSAAYKGYTDVVELLLNDSRVNPADDNNYAIQLAAQNGHTEVVRLLLGDSRVNPAIDNNYAIRMAVENGHTEVVRLLLSDERVDPSAVETFIG